MVSNLFRFDKLIPKFAIISTALNLTHNRQPAKVIRKVKSITEPTELTADLVHEFIERIEVHSPRYLDGKRYQIVDIYYYGVGILNELTPEEMEQGFQEDMKEQRERRAKLAKRKTA